MSESEASSTAMENQPHTNGNPVPIEAEIRVDAPEQVQTKNWSYPLIVELSWWHPEITNGSTITCFCEGFKEGSEDIEFKVDGKEIPGHQEKHGLHDRRSSLVAFYPGENFDEDGRFRIRMTMILKKNDKDLPPKVIESKPFTVSENIKDSDIKPSQVEIGFIRREDIEGRIKGLGYWMKFQPRIGS